MLQRGILVLSILFIGCSETVEGPTLTPQKQLSELGVHDIQVSSNSLCEYPDITIDENGNVCVTYMESREGQERIILVTYQGELQVDSIQVSSTTGYEYRPRLCQADDGLTWIVWSARRKGNWDIYARYRQGSTMSDEYRLTVDDSEDIRPNVCSLKDGRLLVTWESFRKGNGDIYWSIVDKSGGTVPENLSDSENLDLRPAAVTTNGKDALAVWDRQAGNGYQVVSRYFKNGKWGQEEIISPAAGFNMAPALVSTGHGKVTVAWKSNLQPSGKVGIATWIHLREVSRGIPGSMYTLAGDADWDKGYEDQGFEFPSLLQDARGRLWVFGRPSQGFFAQVLDGNRLSSLYRFDKPGWGGRGQLIRAVNDGQGNIYTVRRDVRQIYLNKIAAAELEIPAVRSMEKFTAGPDISADMNQPHSRKLKLPDSLSTFYGDLHQHSSLSDGMGTADECYTRSRYVYGHDFAALTDHEWFVGNLILPSEWEFIKLIGKQFDDPGRFVSIPAYEWTTARWPKGFGHKNVYFENWDEPVFSYRDDARTTPALFDSLASRKSLAIPHHIGWTGIGWENHVDSIQAVVEIVSDHGAFEYMGNEPIMNRGAMPGHFVQDGLAAGHKFGLIGSSDGHGLRFHHGIARKEDPWVNGLAAVVTTKLERGAIVNSLLSRSCFATSGPRIELDFRINNQLQGAELTVVEPPEISFEVIGTTPIHKVELLRNNQVVLAMGKDRRFGFGVKAKFTDSEILPGDNWYYIRIFQENDEMAWSSPVWVNYQR